MSVLKERVHSKEGINEYDLDGRRSSFRRSGSFRRSAGGGGGGSNRSSVRWIKRFFYNEFFYFLFSQNFENIFLNKNKISTSGRLSAGIENGHIISKPPNLINFDETKRSNQQNTEPPFQTQHQYGRTLNVPDSDNVLHVLPTATPAAPLNPPRPAIMSTPKASMISVKNPSTYISVSPTETRPLLLVTTDSDQKQPQTTTVPNGRRLPLNGRMATVMTTKQRQQPTIPINNDHQIVNETTIQRMAPKKYGNSRPRAALFFTSTRMQEEFLKSFVL